MKPRPVEIDFSPVDNQRLANLCGAMDENLRQIENALEVGIARRGERFTLTGSRDRTQRAAELLNRFYARAARELSIDDVQLGLVESRRWRQWVFARRPEAKRRMPQRVMWR